MEGAGTSDDDLPLPEAEEQLRAIALTRRICEGNGEENGALFRALRWIQAKIREQIGEGQVHIIVFQITYEVFGFVFALA